MTADPELKDRLSRAADPLSIDVEERLRALYVARRRRIVRRRAGVFAVAAVVAGLAIVVIWRLEPLGPDTVPAAPAGPSGTLAVMHGTLTQSGVDFAAAAVPVSPGVPAMRLARDASLPAWSPDGTKLAYLTGPNHHVDLLVADADGSNAREIASDLPTFDFAWSPDGGSIAVRTLADGAARLSFVDISTGSLHDDAVFDGDWWNLAWSPDGSRFAFAGPAGLWIQDVDGSDRRMLVSREHIVNPDWSPDGSRLAFGCRAADDDSDYRYDICAVNADGSDLVRLGDWAGWDAVPVWSPDGDWVAFASDRGATAEQIAQNPGGSRLEGVTIFAMRSDGSDVRQLFPTARDGELVPTDWRP